MSVLKALEANFTDYAVYASNDSDMIVVAKNGGALPPLPDPAVLATPAVAEHLRRAGIYNMQDIEVRHVGTLASWRGLLRSFAVPMNSDYRPVLDQGAVKARFLRSDAGALLHFARTPLPMLEMISGHAPSGHPHLGERDSLLRRQLPRRRRHGVARRLPPRRPASRRRQRGDARGHRLGARLQRALALAALARISRRR